MKYTVKKKLIRVEDTTHLTMVWENDYFYKLRNPVSSFFITFFVSSSEVVRMGVGGGGGRGWSTARHSRSCDTRSGEPGVFQRA